MIYAVPNRFKYRHKSQFTVFYFFFFFSAVPNRFKSRHTTRFRNIAFIYFSAVPNRLKYRHASECMHSNETCSSISFPKPSECMLMRHCFHFFLCSSKSFEIPPEYPLKKLRGIISNISLQYQTIYVSNAKGFPWRTNRHSACFRDIVFIILPCSSKSFQIPS